MTPKRLLQLLLPALLTLAAGAAWANAGNLASITSATPPDDWSVRILKYLFGEFATSPFTVGSPSTLMGQLMLTLNAAVFTLGIGWALYGVLGGVVQTAHEGELLGKGMSTVWYPIRAIVGVAGMVPVFGGFTLFQAIMLALTLVGIGIGNSVWTAGVNATSSMTALINESQFVPSSMTRVQAAARQVFVSQVCLAGETALEAQMQPPIADSQKSRIKEFADGNEVGYNFGSPDDPKKCGFISMTAAARSGSSATGFRVASVDYAAIAQVAHNAYVQGASQMTQQLSLLGSKWYADWQAARAAGQPSPAIPLAAIDATAAQFAASTSQAIHAHQIDRSALTEGAKANMLSLGWLGAGAWFSTFAEANAAIADAAKGPTMSTDGPRGVAVQLGSISAMAYNAAAEKMADATAAAAAQNTDPTRALLDSAIADSCDLAGVDMSGSLGTATGNCSLGQSIVSAALRATAVGSGGGGNGAGSIGPDSAGLVNPIIVAKNIGDYAMSFSSTILGGQFFAWAGEKFLPGGAGKVIGGLADKAGGGLVKKVIGEEGMAALQSIAIVMLVGGALLSLYIPFIPFITWIGASMAYFTSVLEGLVGASLHAMSHLDTQGEGMGQRTAHGYIFWMNVAFRPGLMILGFFAGLGLLIGVGTFALHLFLPAMANVQGNSLTGIASIVGLLIIAFVVLLQVAHAAMHIPFVLTDQVIGFLGNAINSHLGRDVEDKVHGLFVMAARTGPTAIGQVGSARAGARAEQERRRQAAAGGGGSKPPGEVRP